MQQRFTTRVVDTLRISHDCILLINTIKEEVLEKVSKHKEIQKFLVQGGRLRKLDKKLLELENQIAFNAYAQISAQVFDSYSYVAKLKSI